MADASVAASKLIELLNAKGWSASARRFTISAEEPALDTIEHRWMAGDAKTMSTGEVLQVRPARIIVQDFAPAPEVDRLKAAMSEYGAPQIYTLTRFIDVLWDARTASARAFKDSETTDPDASFSSHIADPDARHIEQRLTLGESEVADHRLLEAGLPFESSCLAVLADAGLGKSELLRWHEWRSAVMYRSAWNQGIASLPPIAIRVPLRDVRSLSLDGIAHYLSHPMQEDDLPPLRLVDSGSVLRQILRLQRIILLLDGVDEMSLEPTKLDAGILQLRREASAGAKIVITARTGHAISRGSVANRFSETEIARILPLTEPLARSLLTNNGADDTRAGEILGSLAGSPAVGVPLFLLLANEVELRGPLDERVLESRTRVLLRLLELFCLRDEGRLGVSSQDQMSFLTSIAEWTSVLGEPQNVDTLLDLLGLANDDPAVSILRNPHALLDVSDVGVIDFRHPQFFSLFSAKAISDNWEDFGINSIWDVLSSKELDDSVLDFSARLLRPELIRSAWLGTMGQDRATLLVRRNVLGLALSIVADTVNGGSARARSEELERVLGNRRIEEVGLAGLFIEKFDFADWTFSRLQGRRGTLRYCENLDRSDFDKSVLTIGELDGCSFHRRVVEYDYAASLRRIAQLARPLRRKRGGGFIAIMSLEEARDPQAWNILVSHKLADREGKASAARWVLNRDGLLAVSTLTELEGADDGIVEDALAAEPHLRKLLEALS